jgi:uncharacterized BrkB/YihY/UPF0761 family membrane protein
VHLFVESVVTYLVVAIFMLVLLLYMSFLVITYYLVLLQAVEPPNEEAISSAVDLLYKVVFSFCLLTFCLLTRYTCMHCEKHKYAWQSWLFFW